MNLPEKEPNAVLAKALSLANKSLQRLQQIDHLVFPTAASASARTLLCKVFETLQDPVKNEPMDPAVLYRSVLSLQNLVALLERSTTEHISWPLVSYCTKIWKDFFGNAGPKIFYSVTPDHNYYISDFSQQVTLCLSDLLPHDQLTEVVGEDTIYCLQLASLENENLPLYAIIGHEFGHAIFWRHEKELVQSLLTSSSNFLNQILLEFIETDSERARRRAILTTAALRKFAEELFCDLVGSLLMGPSFYLSLYEISWGQIKNNFTVSLAPKLSEIQAYPSFQFRLSCVIESANIRNFCDSATKEFEILQNKEILHMTTNLPSVSTFGEDDHAIVWPTADPDSIAIEKILNTHLIELKSVLGGFLKLADKNFREWYPSSIPDIDVASVSRLLERLENRIVPNIVPDNTLLGRPADFVTILNAASLNRLHVLVSHSKDKDEDLTTQLGILERLTAKAFEVSYVQRDFNEHIGSK